VQEAGQALTLIASTAWFQAYGPQLESGNAVPERDPSLDPDFAEYYEEWLAIAGLDRADSLEDAQVLAEAAAPGAAAPADGVDGDQPPPTTSPRSLSPPPDPSAVADTVALPS